MKCLRSTLLACAAAGWLIAHASAGDSSDRAGVGFRIRSFALKDQRGKQVSLARIADQKLVVVAFLGTECPLVQLYGPRLAELAAEYEPKGVVFLAVDSNPQDTRADLLAFTQDCGIKFPMLRDMGTAVADHFQVARTPEVFVLDRDRTVRYRGRIDDQYGLQEGVSYKRPKPERRDLAVALEELLADKPVSQPITEATGCLISRAREPKTEGKVTFTRDIAPIFNKRCVVCHRPGEIAPFSLLRYEDTVGWEAMIREVVDEGRMPPWHADPQHGHFSNDSRLGDEEKERILAWVDEGSPKGAPEDQPKPPRFAGGWQIPRPDLIVKMDSKPCHVPADGTVNYKYLTVDPHFSQDMWVQAAEALPGNRAVVHHIIVFIEPKDGRQSILPIDGFLVATAPGARPLMLPPGMAKRIPAGSKLKFQMHYTPNGSPQEDLSSVGLVFAEADSVKTVVRTDAAFNIIFKIPPGADNYAVQSMRTLGKDTTLVSLYPHMHLRGKAFRYTARYPDGKEEILLDIPRYDFNWQNTYELAEPKLLPKGTELRCLAHFDNSQKNLANPDPKQEIGFGEQTWEEMMIGFFDVALPRDASSEVKAVARSSGAKAPRDKKGAKPPRKAKSKVVRPVSDSREKR